jgi:uncharacterized membrane protein
MSSDILQKVFRYINRDETRKQIQVYVVDPILSHIMERVFPYILLFCVFFVVLLLLVAATLVIIVFQLRANNYSAVGMIDAVSAI